MGEQKNWPGGPAGPPLARRAGGPGSRELDTGRQQLPGQLLCDSLLPPGPATVLLPVLFKIYHVSSLSPSELGAQRTGRALVAGPPDFNFKLMSAGRFKIYPIKRRR